MREKLKVSESRAKYDEELELFDDLVGATMKVSTVSGGVWRPTRHIVSTQLYTRLTVSANTFLRVLPHNRLLAGVEDFWDWPSAASLTRTMIELYLSFFFIGVDQTDDQDHDFRLRQFYYHSNYEKWRFYKDFGAPAEIVADFATKLPEAKRALESHPMFARLTRDQQKRVSSSRHHLYLRRSEVVQRLPFAAPEIELFYRFLSHQVHSTPLAALSQSDERGRGFENEAERTYLTWAIRLWRKYLGASIVGIEGYFGDHYESLTDPELLDALFIGRTNLERLMEEGVRA